MELFANSASLNFEPLAARMRPRNLDEFIGQEHILGKGRLLLRRAITADQLSSLIFYGPPGTGKTTLARVIANLTKSRFIAVNAVLCGVKDIREAVAEAQDSRNLHGQRTILFVDEVHRWNKAQQDALLPWVENGTVILIGATTENPFFEVNAALVSRSRLFQLKSLTSADLHRILDQALADKERGYGAYQVEIAPEAAEHLIKISDGDGRTLLNALELAVQTSVEFFPPPHGTRITVDLTAAEDSIQKKAILYDKEGDYHYDTVSAFIKSLRGSDPDAALYWAARMVAGGEIRILLRRMIVFASEDIGMADPNALRVAMTSAEAFERIGMPEGRFPLAQAILYLSTAPKSNSAFGFFDALGTVEKEMQEEVPNHLRDGNRDKEGFGHGEGYLYPHSYREHWVAQQYLPAALNGRLFYKPSSNGYEESIKEKVLSRREAQLAAAVSDHDEILIFSKQDRKKEQWLNRTLNRFDEYLLGMRDFIFDGLKITPYSSILLPDADDSVLLWEAVRKCPHGAVAAVFRTQKAYELAQGLAGSVNEPERPFLYQNALPADPELPTPFEWLIANTSSDQLKKVLETFPAEYAQGSRLSLGLLRKEDGMRLSSFFPDSESENYKAFALAEEEFYSGLCVSQDQIRAMLAEKGWDQIEFAQTKLEYGKFLAPGIIVHWLSDKSPLGKFICEKISAKAVEEIVKILSQKENTVVPWSRSLYRIRSR